MKKVSKKANKKKVVSQNLRQTSLFLGQMSKIMDFFYDYPNTKLTVRSLAEKTALPRSTVQNYLNQLKRLGIISPENRWIDSWKNRSLKTIYFLDKIVESGLVDYLDDELAASAIILFGSIRKGESTKSSDIDIFVESARNKKVNLSLFEKRLGHEIQLFTKPKITLLPKELLNNVLNGIKLKGYFTLK